MTDSPFPRVWRQLMTAAGVCLAFALGAVVLAQPPTPAPEAPPPDAVAAPAAAGQDVAEQAEYLTRGPLHEAFAEPYTAEPLPAPVVTAQLPEPIEELPPEYRPEGDNVVWIPGYWAWDEELEDFLWVSGLWRELPPNQRWVPGYWAAVDGGHRWVSGFWASDQVAEVQYLPAPPESIERGPSSPPPAENHFYIPGHWVYGADGFRWRAGFWSPIHESWVWVPAQYIWTPRGTVFRPGYWDYDIAYRGVVFTPVYYRQPIYQSPDYVYRPRYTIDTGVNLLVHLFVRPNARQYYFGDYYGSRYANAYQPWITRYQQPTLYDPFYAQYRFRPAGRSGSVLDWVSTQHQVFATSEQIRPARTIAQQQELLQASRAENLDPTVLRLAAVGEAIENLVDERDSVFQFRPLEQEELQGIRQAREPLRELIQSRRQVETQLAAATESAAATTDPAPTPEATPQDDGRASDAEAGQAAAATQGTLTLPAVVSRPAVRRGEQRAQRGEQAAEQPAGRQPAAGDVSRQAPSPRDQSPRDQSPRDDGPGEALPPGEDAVELTPEEQRDRRFSARAATPPMTGQTPTVGTSPDEEVEQPAGEDRRPGVAGRPRDVTDVRPGITGARPEDTGADTAPREPTEPPRGAGEVPGVTRAVPGAATPGAATPGATTPGATAPAPAATERAPVADAPADAATPRSRAPGSPAPGSPATLPGTEQRDPNAGERMRGDVRQIPGRGSAGEQRAIQRMRPARPESWPSGQFRGQRPSTLPARPGSGAVEDLTTPPAVQPGGRPEIGGAAADLQQGTVPRAGVLAPGGAPGVERGAPGQTGSARSREAQPFTLPDLSDEEGLRQRR